MKTYRPNAVERSAEKRLADILAASAAQRTDAKFVQQAIGRSSMRALRERAPVDRTVEVLHNRASILRHLSRGSINVAAEVSRLIQPRIYCFERNKGRWPDGLFHLVDRGYSPFPGASFTREELDSLGWLAWHDTRWRQIATADWIVAVAGDDFVNTCSPQGLLFLADLLHNTGSYLADRAIAAEKGGAA